MEEWGRYSKVSRGWGGRRKTGEEKGRRQRTEDREERLEKQIKRNGADTVRWEGDGEEGGRMEEEKGR